MQPTTDTVTLREVTAETLGAILRLDVRDDQRHLVASNAKSIAQAHFDEHAWFRAIYAGETPVGFVMLYLNAGEAEYWVWRFMVDARYQRRGYGRQAMALAVEHVRGFPDAEALYLSYVPDEASALPFYQRCGFVETGRWEGGEKVMVLRVVNQPTLPGVNPM